jgi:hypothetical protein
MFTIELMGGPDDGAVFDTTDLPPFWEMMSDMICDGCALKGLHTPLDSERYWKSQRRTAGGHYVYYHEETTNPGVLLIL